MSIRWTDEELETADIDKRKLQSLVTRMRKCAEDMRKLDLVVYGCDGQGYLIHKSRPEHDHDGKADFGAIVANIGHGFDGGGW